MSRSGYVLILLALSTAPSFAEEPRGSDVVVPGLSDDVFLSAGAPSQCMIPTVHANGDITFRLPGEPECAGQWRAIAESLAAGVALWLSGYLYPKESE